jgi:uncharacterized protein YfcZ (UPF0381/DUF406 family)
MTSINRREFYRVRTHVSIELSPFKKKQNVAATSTDALIKSTIEEVATCFNLSPSFNFLAEFQRIELENKQLLRQIIESDSRVGLYLKMLNKKVDTLAQAMLFSDVKVNPDTVMDLDLSEGGLAMESTNTYKIDELLAVKLILLPDHIVLLLKAKVLDCRSSDSDKSQLHLEFVDIDDHQRQLIARYLIRLQAESIKRKI